MSTKSTYGMQATVADCASAVFLFGRREHAATTLYLQ